MKRYITPEIKTHIVQRPLLSTTSDIRIDLTENVDDSYQAKQGIFEDLDMDQEENQGDSWGSAW